MFPMGIPASLHRLLSTIFLSVSDLAQALMALPRGRSSVTTCAAPIRHVSRDCVTAGSRGAYRRTDFRNDQITSALSMSWFWGPSIRTIGPPPSTLDRDGCQWPPPFTR